MNHSSRTTGLRRRSTLAALAAVLSLGLVVAGCGSGSAGSSSSAATAGSSDTAPASTATAGSSSAPASSGSGAATPSSGETTGGDAFTPTGNPPPSSGPKAQKGKNVWLISCVVFEGCQRINTGIQAAADALGWNLKVVDAKNDPSTIVKSINDAVAAHADGIIELPVDCPVIKAGLLAAKQANIPVVSWGGLDCNDKRFGGSDAPLFAAEVKFGGGQSWADWYALEGKNAADFVVKRAAELGITNPSILQFQNTDQALNAAEAEAFSSQVKATCATCTLTPVDFTIAQMTSGKGQQIFSSAILAHPDTNVLYYAWDALLPGGLQNAISGAPKGQFKLICCGDGGQGGYAAARANPGTWAINAYGEAWAGWATADVLNRVFAGSTDFPDEGGQYLFVDSDHNMPADGKYAEGSIDYAAAYKAVWGN